jgi:hypothetical protein
MGLEAVCTCRIDNEAAEAKALLEARELILRAPFKRTIAIAAMENVRVEDGDLLFSAGGARIAIGLGAATAAKWAKKIATPAPSLAAKLGIGHASPALVIGPVEDSALVEALDQHVATGPADAKLSLAIVDSAAALDAALAVHAALPAGSPIWLVYAKGAKAAFGDGAVRAHMRAIGFIDSKSSAVSETLSATRYARR